MFSYRFVGPALLILVLACTSSVSLAEAQGGAVRGRVYVRDYLGDYVPAGFASIVARSEFFEASIRTDIDGYYLAYLPAGTYNMTAILSTITLNYIQSKSVAVWDGSDTTINFYLELAVSKYQTARATISIDGFPSQYSTSVRIDDSEAGTIPGGETKSFDIRAEVDYTFSVQTYVEGSKGERFYCQANSWLLEGRRDRIVENSASHTFHFTTQYFLSVSAPYGDAARNSGWHEDGTSVHLSTPTTVEVSQGTREVFDAWIISGLENRVSNITVAVNKPLEIKAEYRREYYLQVISEYGKPSGSGWYREGSSAEIWIEKEMPLPGLVGALGGRRIFDGWSGGASSVNNAILVYMDSPKTVTASWREEYFMPYAIIILTSIIIVMVVVSQKWIGRNREQ